MSTPTLEPDQSTPTTGAVGVDDAPASERWRIILRQVARRPMVVLGVLVVVALFVLAFAGTSLARYTYDYLDYSALSKPPDALHWWGTSRNGQDIFAQSVRGLQKSLIIGLLVAVFSTTIAALAGGVAGYFRGVSDKVILVVVDLLLVFPSFMIISLAAPRMRSAGWIVLVVLIVLFGWMISARVVRSMTLAVAASDFVAAAEFAGVSRWRILVRHILPAVSSFLVIDGTLAVGGAVIAETGLAYLGFGVQAPDVSLGTLISAGVDSVSTYPWMFAFPAGLLVLFVLSVNLIGDGLRDALDPASAANRLNRKAHRRWSLRRPPVVDLAVSASIPAMTDGIPVVEVTDLRISFPGQDDPVRAVRGIGLSLSKGETLALVGESGSGKSLTALAMMGLLPRQADVTGSVTVQGRDVLGMPERDRDRLRGNAVAMIFQDPLSAFTPVYTIGDQIVEAIRTHRDVSRRAAAEQSVELLRSVGIPDPRERAKQFPHQFSGGMRQRALIAMALANDPELLLADEPTTALDVTIQAQILELLQEAKARADAAMLFVSHDLGVVARVADRVAVMQDGQIVEHGPVRTIFADPQHPYTRRLLAAVPRLDRVSESTPVSLTKNGASGGTTETVLAVRGLEKTFALSSGGVVGRRLGSVYAVDGVDLHLNKGETLALVGESGSGKTTTLLEILRLHTPQAGSVEVLGTDVGQLNRRSRQELRKHLQVVLQDPASSLDGRMRVVDIITEPMVAQGIPATEARAAVPVLLRQVELPADFTGRYPHQLSGGQRQRVSIARALSVKPDMVLLDEPVSALDVSVRAEVLGLLQRLQLQQNLSYVLVSHDLAVVSTVAHRVAIMYLGRIVEQGPVAQVFADPRHPYTKALLSAVPIPDPEVEAGRRRMLLPGDPPSPTVAHQGCGFRSRCPIYQILGPDEQKNCTDVRPAIVDGAGHDAACHYPERFAATYAS